VFDLITKMARDRGVSVLYSELIGLLPRDALADATPEYLRLIDFSEDRIIESHIQF